MITFKKVRDAFGWMGNMSPHPIRSGWGDVQLDYYTAEHFFQRCRFEDLDVIKEIRATKSPMGAKMVAKKHAAKMVVVPRSAIDIENMRETLCRKFSCNRELGPLLLATGDEELVEDVSNRPNESGMFWGKANINGTWVGQNVLGLLLMEHRAILRACPPTPSSLPLSS